jgi:molecular chaperone Hsp33
MSTSQQPAFVQRFLLEDLDIRGAVVQLGDAWAAMQHGRDYPPAVAALLGEMSAIAVLITEQMKQEGRLTFQLQGEGPVNMLVVDCYSDLRLRGMARADGPVPANHNAAQLIGQGQLALLLDLPLARDPYQSFVPLDGDSVAEIFEHYLAQSEQQPTRLLLAASGDQACGLLLQKLPGADERDADGWSRVNQLLATVKQEELLGLPAETLLGRVFAEETVRVYTPHPVNYYCPYDRDKIAGMLQQLGQQEAEAIIAEHGEIVVHDDICNHEYRFTAADVAAIFTLPPVEKPTHH